jgi:hypothetical protein
VFVEVASVARATVNDVDDNLAQAAGFEDAGRFFAWWRTQHHGVENPAMGPLLVDEPVWVVWFKVAGDPPRLLHRNSQRGYTRNPHQALEGEPEAVPELAQQAITDEAHMRHQRRWRERQEHWERLTLSQKAFEVERLLQTGGGNGLVRRDLQTATERLTRAHRKLLGDSVEDAA